MTVPSQVSYVSGTSDKPLLGDTIGDDFDRAEPVEQGEHRVAQHPAGEGRVVLAHPGRAADEHDHGPPAAHPEVVEGAREPREARHPHGGPGCAHGGLPSPGTP